MRTWPSEGIDPIQAAHKQLHMALVFGCISKHLTTMHDLLFDQAARYRDIMISEVRSVRTLDLYCESSLRSTAQTARNRGANNIAKGQAINAVTAAAVAPQLGPAQSPITPYNTGESAPDPIVPV